VYVTLKVFCLLGLISRENACTGACIVPQDNNKAKLTLLSKKLGRGLLRSTRHGIATYASHRTQTPEAPCLATEHQDEAGYKAEAQSSPWLHLNLLGEKCNTGKSLARPPGHSALLAQCPINQHTSMITNMDPSCDTDRAKSLTKIDRAGCKIF
jgi:hypothetical protein